MKNYTLILCMFLLSGCLNNDFMERYPLGNPTAETAFVSYDNFKAYAWGLYETFPALGYGSENATDDISYNHVHMVPVEEDFYLGNPAGLEVSLLFLIKKKILHGNITVSSAALI